MSVVAAIRKMLDAGLSIEQALVAAEAFEATSIRAYDDRDADRREADRIRKRRERERKRLAETTVASEMSRDIRVTSVTSPSPSPAPSPDKEIPPTPPKENNLFPLPPSTPRVSDGREQAMFDRFWQVYPNKVGKADARKAFSKALTRTSAEEMAAGLHRYVAKTDDRPWCNPATWLNQDRWGDRPAEVARGSPRGETAVERQVRELKGKIEDDYGFGRKESSGFGDADGLPLLIAADRGAG